MNTSVRRPKNISAEDVRSSVQRTLAVIREHHETNPSKCIGSAWGTLGLILTLCGDEYPRAPWDSPYVPSARNELERESGRRDGE